ncbi:hypothetical protein WAK64_06270 [Bacillus spongiae]|uniref:Uncharacterized protein n=1 Tax=Bacillus spongiae TaxID=2683610 RepID=A0ABU8HBR7_9BACI
MEVKLEEFLEDPWWVITKSMAEVLNNELIKELSPSHVLYGKKSVAVARRNDNDDVIYWVNEIDKYAIVHLTYSKENSSAFPSTKLFTLRELEKHCKEVSEFF